MLRAHLARQDEAKASLGDDWGDHDLLFTEPNGSPRHPADVADEFARLIKLAGLPRSPCMAYATVPPPWLSVRGDMKVIQHMLRH
ncbi:hypothetical protein ABJI51_35735 [Amycolatopsis sp. NEAU-NG30]|uniref:Uncharacterized protein n=1 Tax=Amycolatopsis melonis TaxID=3156488 RepID=A0ABV0LSL7_9PSEU